MITYLCATCDNPAVRGDLLIYDKLVEKAERIHRDLGDDPARLTGLFSAQDEEAHIEHQLVLGGPDRILDTPLDTAGFSLADLFTAAPDDDAPTTAERPLLYPDNEAHFRALADLAGIEFEVDGGIVDIRLPETEAAALRTVLPAEARPKEARLLGAFSPEKVVDSIARSREKARRNDTSPWPDIHLLWEQHPLVAMLIEQALCSVERNRAPLITTPEPAGHAAYLFQTTLSNTQGRPLRTAWLCLGNPEDRCDPRADIAHALRAHGLDPARPWPNTAAPTPEQIDRLEAGIPRAVQRAHRIAAEIRNEAVASGKPRTADALARLERWRDTQRARAQADLARYADNPLHKARVERLLRDKEAEFSRHRLHLEQLHTPEHHASLRLVAVLAGTR